MAFLNERFPDDIARGAVGGHGCWSTALVELSDGAETAVQQWLRARGIWNVSQGLKIADADGELVEDPRRHEAARDFFYMCRGRLHRFRFKDWGDFTMARQAIGATNGSAATSSAVSTACTPGAWRTADQSTAVMRAWAWGERITQACSMPG